MKNRNEILEALDCCIIKGDNYPLCGECPYREEELGTCETLNHLLTDVRDLLRIRGWVKEIGRHNHWHCSECGFVEGVHAFVCKCCPNCGACLGEIDMSEFDPNVRQRALKLGGNMP